MAEDWKAEDSRKIFVGGLPTTADKECVQEYFSKYGDIDMCTIKTDVYTGRSRGFGFVIFREEASLAKAVNEPAGTHVINDKPVDVKKAKPQTTDDESNTKVFVGGLDKTITKEDLTAAFSTRGNVVDIYLPMDKSTNEPKGFAFVNFDNSSIAKTLCTEGKITINGKECDIKKANNKNDSRNRGGGRGGRGGFGGRGGYGGYDQYGGGGYGGGNYGGYNQGYGGGGGYQGGYGGPGGGYGGYDVYNNGGGYDQNASYGHY